MKLYQTTLPVSYVNTFLDGVKISPLELSRILQLAGITEELLSKVDSRITQEQFSTLFKLLVERVDDEVLGIYGRPLRRGSLKILMLLLLDASNLHSALRRWQQFDRILSDEFSFVLIRTNENLSLTLNRYPRDTRDPRLVQEFHLKLVHGLASWVIGKKIIPERVDFAVWQSS